MDEHSERITQLLASDDPRAAEALLPLIYQDLRRLARHRLAKEPAGQTLQPTALVHEAYLRIVGAEGNPGWDNRGHFFAAAAEAMRRILIDQARRKQRQRHGGGATRVDLDEVEIAIDAPSYGDLLAVDEALQALEAADERARSIANLRYFSGMSNRETAEALGISVPTVEREWRFIRTFLQSKLGYDL